MSFDWEALWDRKGGTASGSHLEISGLENFPDFDSVAAAQRLTEAAGIKPTDSVLEIGCAAGILARHLNCAQYVGIDRSASMIKKTIELNGFSAIRCDADDLIFKDKTFDIVFAFSVFQYFPNQDYARKVISEMTRVARKAVCISDLAAVSHDASHCLFDQSFFAGWEISDAFYLRTLKRYTAVLRL